MDKKQKAKHAIKFYGCPSQFNAIRQKNLSIAKEVMERLEVLEPYIYHRAQTGSIYIKFKDSRLRSLRIADHTGREKYKYKWNIMTDNSADDTAIRRVDSNVPRYFFNYDNIEAFYKHIISYYNTIVKNDIVNKGKRQDETPIGDLI